MYPSVIRVDLHAGVFSNPNSSRRNTTCLRESGLTAAELQPRPVASNHQRNSGTDRQVVSPINWFYVYCCRLFLFCNLFLSFLPLPPSSIYFSLNLFVHLKLNMLLKSYYCWSHIYSCLVNLFRTEKNTEKKHIALNKPVTAKDDGTRWLIEKRALQNDISGK